ncbi:MAG TPA: hypothetical protein VFM90_01330, partial [Cyclobacteriaceae bacterium]|nr:hypothetical protein [Cyclobacteriaceae bacterium]
MTRYLLFLFLITGPVSLLAQETEPEDQRFTVDTPVNLDFLKEEKVEEAPRKKRVKKKVFYGIKTKKGFSRRGTGNRVSYELFYYLKKSEMPKTFVRDIYYYDYARREIIRTSKFDPK